jgi:predicted RNase H-like nuclease
VSRRPLSGPPAVDTWSVERVIGVDACKGGWVGFTNDARGYFGPSIAELLALADGDGRIAVVAIDIPIGLPTNGPRQADILARSLVGGRASSVFPTPVRAALTAATHSEATAINLRATGKGLSQQAFALGPRILEVDAWVESAGRTAIEVHPELSFATMAHRSLVHSKSTWAGAEERRELLMQVGLAPPPDLGRAGEKAGVADVLDAAAGCWTAIRYHRGSAVAHPAPPESFGDGHPAAIWA